MKTSKWTFTFLITVAAPVLAAVILYQLESFDPAAYPTHELSSGPPISAPKRNSHVLLGSEKIGEGQLLAPEDIAYDPESGTLYTGCVDGWIKRVILNESKVESWINTGGRPLGLVLGHHGELIIADADKGLLNASKDGSLQLLTDEADGLKFMLTDGVDIAQDGVIYFTDASYRYRFHEFIWDILEGRPYGRFMSYDPSTRQTKVLVGDLYLANGVAVSPDQSSVIFCETPMRRCKRYYIKGERKGSVDTFIENLPGLPDNIRYDGDGQYWIAFSSGSTYALELLLRYPFLRKVTGILEKYGGRPHIEEHGGAFAVDLEGKPIEHYHDRHMALISGSIKIGDHLYFGSIKYPYMIRQNLTRNPAVAAS